MRLHKLLTVAGNSVAVIDDDVRLDLFAPGRAAFTVKSEKPLRGLVHLDMGYRADGLQRFFVGYVVSSTTVDASRQKIFCRELTAALTKRLPLNLRYVTLAEVLADIAAQTGIEFVAGRGDYAALKAPAFYSAFTGYWVLDRLGESFAIPKFIWQQQGDGKVFVGSWSDSFWAGRPLDLPLGLPTNFGVANRAKIPCIPRLRPGVFLNGDYVTKVELSGNHMNLTWSADPWKSK